jgi:hypothetical protein
MGKTRAAMKVFGYSERGAINALIYEIAFSTKPETLIHRFFKRTQWPLCLTPPTHIYTAKCKTILIEQSLSDFGDADIIFLFEAFGKKSCVFLEAKCGDNWSIRKEWSKFIYQFINNIRGKGLTSNIFCQLYFKQRLTDALVRNEDIHIGLKFDGPLSTIRSNGCRKIGTNLIVQDSVEFIKLYLLDAYYLMLIPQIESQKSIRLIFKEINKYKNTPRGWGLSKWGIISWRDIEEFCKEEELKHTLSILKFNNGQIYSKNSKSPLISNKRESE